MTPPIRWGILGTADIAAGQVIPAIKSSGNGLVAAVASRSLDKAQAFAAKHGIPVAHGSYEAMLADPGIDAVYLPLPVSLHAPWALRCIAAGKPVLVETPFASDVAEVRQVFAAAQAAGVPVGEGYMYRFHPVTRSVRELVATGRIGTPVVLRATFTIDLALKKTEDIRLRADTGGGAMRDLGCYCTGIMRLITGEEPQQVAAVASRNAQGVDLSLAGALRFPSGAIGHFGVSLGASFDCSYEVIGTAGRIRVDKGGMVAWPGEAFPITLWTAEGREDLVIPAANHYQLMVEAFAGQLLGGPAYPISASESLANQQAIDDLLHAASQP